MLSTKALSDFKGRCLKIELTREKIQINDRRLRCFISACGQGHGSAARLLTNPVCQKELKAHGSFYTNSTQTLTPMFQVCNILWDLFNSLLYTLTSITSPYGQLVYLLQGVKNLTTNVNNAMPLCLFVVIYLRCNVFSSLIQPSKGYIPMP